MRQRILMLVTVGLLVAGDAPQKEKGTREMKHLQGTWKVVQAKRDGEMVAALKGGTVTLEGNKFTSKTGETILGQGTWKVDPGRKPKTIDIEYTQGPEKGKKVLGICHLTKGTWILALGPPGKERPSSF